MSDGDYLMSNNGHHFDLSAEPTHEQAQLTNFKLTQQHHDGLPHHHHHHPIHAAVVNHHGLITTLPNAHDSSIMAPMMSLGLVNFPVAFFKVTAPWEFVLLIAICLLFSFLVEFARVRNAIGSLVAILNRVGSRTKNPVVAKRYKPIDDQHLFGPKQFGVRKPSFSNDDIEGGNQDNEQQQNYDGNNIRTKKRFQKRGNIINSGDNFMTAVPQHHIPELPPAGGLVIRLLQFVHYFALIFFHYALMVAAMSNFWILVTISVGAGLGHVIGSWTNDYEAARIYQRSSSEKMKSNSSASEVMMLAVPDIKVETHDDNTTSNEDDDDNDYDELDNNNKENRSGEDSHNYCQITTGSGSTGENDRAGEQERPPANESNQNQSGDPFGQ